MANEFKFNFSLEEEDRKGFNSVQNTIRDGDTLSESSKIEGQPCGLSSLGPESVPESGSPENDKLASCKEHSITETFSCTSINDIIMQNTNFTTYKTEVVNPKNSNPAFLYYLTEESIDELLKDRAAKSNLKELIAHSDLCSGVYEGGFKVWECSLDLVEYLKSKRTSLVDKSVLELGCGGALPSIYSLLCGASFVCFQDFNEEVIDCFTIPNAVHNLSKSYNMTQEQNSEIENLEELKSKTMFLSGDWKAVDVFLKSKNIEFDLIVSSETIYNVNYYPALHSLICNCLRKNGHALLANKTYYFGVGGSSKDFAEYVKKQGRLSIEVILEINEGVNREILKLEWL